MALDARTRSSIYEKLKPILGDDDANALMSEFPAREHDELVTKQFLRAELAEFRTELAEFRTELADRLRRQTVFIVGSLFAAVGTATGIARALS